MSITTPVTASFGQQEIDDGVREIVMEALTLDEGQYSVSSALKSMNAWQIDVLDIKFRMQQAFGMSDPDPKLELTNTPAELSALVATYLRSAGRFRT